MKTLIPILLLAWSALATDRITATLTVTNLPAQDQTITVNADLRIWKTNVTSPTYEMQIGASQQVSVTNFWNHITAYPFTGVVPVWVTSNRIDLIGSSGAALSITVDPWVSVTYSTQTVTTLQTVRVPLSSESVAVRTNAATLLLSGIGSYSLAPLSQVTTAAAELVGTTNTQTISGAKTWTGANIFSSITTTNLVNHGNAVSSPGSTNGAEQFGTGAVASGKQSTAIGYSAEASGLNSFAAGYQSEATGQASLAVIGYALADNAVALGGYASAPYSLALGNGEAVGTNSIAIGYNSYAGGSGSVAIGVNVTVSTTNTIAIGASSDTVKLDGTLVESGASYLASLNATAGTLTNGVFNSPRLTNSTVHASWLQGTLSSLSGGYLSGVGATNFVVTNLTATGTQSLGGIVQFPQSTSSALANGNNAAVALGSTSYLKLLSGPTGAFSVNGIAGGATGRLLWLQNGTGQTMTIANDSGVDPTAANRIYTGRGADLVVTNGNLIVQLIYDSNASRWVVVSP